MNLNEHSALSESLKITKLAIEHSYIKKSNDPKEAAENIHEFYKTLTELFVGSKDQDNQ